MKLKKVMAFLSVAVVLAVLTISVNAQRDHQYKNPYGPEVTTKAADPLTRYDNPMPKVDAAASTNWVLHHLDLANTRYSPLDQINKSNVKLLVPSWLFQTGVIAGSSFQTTPIVVDGIMYLTDPKGNVYAIDATTGQRLWTYAVDNLIGGGENGITNRGLAYGDGYVYFAAGPSVFALDAKTGAPVQSFGNQGRADILLNVLKAKYPDVDHPIELGYSFTVAPQYYNGMVIVTTALSELHIPGGLVLAIDGKTGKLIWKFNTVPQGPDDDGWEIAKDTWQGGVRNGGGVWETPSIDPALGLIYLSVGNPSPDQDGSARKGINLFTCSYIALDLNTGKLKWYFQQVHHEIWDYDAVSQPTLFDIQVGGRTIKALGTGNKNGLVYIVNRETGAPINPMIETPVSTETATPGEQPWPTQPIPYTAFGAPMEPVVPLYPLDVPSSYSSKYPLVPFYTPTKVSGAIHAPRAGVEFGGSSFSPQTGLLYIAGLDVPIYMTSTPVGATLQPGQSSTAGTRISVRTPYGNVSAYDPATGELAWRTKLPGGVQAGTMATAGGLVFAGDSVGFLYAFDAATGKILWKFNTGSAIHGGPMTYQINGVQYISVPSGGIKNGPYTSLPGGDLIVTFALVNP